MFTGKSFALAFAFCLVVITAMAARRGQEQKSSGTPPPRQDRTEQVPVAAFDAPEPNTDAERAYRLEKGRHYDNMNLVYEQPDEVWSKSDHWHRDLDAIPVAQSDLVVSANVVDAKAYLSNDKTGIYSEFTVRANEVLKNDAHATLGKDGTIIIDRVGGSVLFPSGHLQTTHPFAGQKLPQIGRQYLFFLKADEGGQILSILTAYEVREGKVFALDDIRKFADLNGTDEANFLSMMRNQRRK
jgi:hypothetical protein